MPKAKRGLVGGCAAILACTLSPAPWLRVPPPDLSTSRTRAAEFAARRCAPRGKQRSAQGATLLGLSPLPLGAHAASRSAVSTEEGPTFPVSSWQRETCPPDLNPPPPRPPEPRRSPGGIEAACAHPQRLLAAGLSGNRGGCRSPALCKAPQRGGDRRAGTREGHQQSTRAPGAQGPRRRRRQSLRPLQGGAGRKERGKAKYRLVQALRAGMRLAAAVAHPGRLAGTGTSFIQRVSGNC